jgi:hypothetical protein
MDKELIDQLWNRATRETLNSGALNERYRFAELVAAHENEGLANHFEGHWRSEWTDKEIAEKIRGLLGWEHF